MPASLAAGGGCTNQTSHDPNALVGPTGYGKPGFILTGGTWPYTIEFENDPKNASAPAQDVTVTEQLDPNLDWSTFHLGTFGFGSVNVAVPSGLTQYQTTVPYQNTDGSSLNVKVNLNFNVQTGLLTVSFASIDPLTGQAPTGVFDGFLPPNDSSHVGEGYVQYTVQPKTGLASGTEIRAVASIVFDTNAPLATNLVDDNDPSKGTDPNKEVLVTIDATTPTSSVNPLPAIVNSSSFTVSWSGSDPNGPGIASFNVYVSDNGGAFTPWLTGTTQTSATYTGQNGHTYRFYSVATDFLGLTQPTPAVQATTTVSAAPPPVITGNPSSQNVNDVQTATFTASASGAASVQWQVSTDGGNTWSNLSGATGTTLTLNNPSLAMNGYQYRAVFSNGAGINYTSAASLTVAVFTPSSPIELIEEIYLDLYALLLQNDPSFLAVLNSLSESMLGQPLPPTVDLLPTIGADITALMDDLLTI